jgi:hypothetical protein
MYDRLVRIFEGFLGDSWRGASENGQCQYPCPYCGSGKTNLEVSFSKGVYKSWCCPDNSGKLSSLIKQFGNEQIFREYRDEITSIRNSKLYQLNFRDTEWGDFGENLFELPVCCKKLTKNYYHAYKYVVDRGIDDNMIKKYNICCTGDVCSDDWKMKNRIVFPSYDRYNALNYWVGRLYKESKYQSVYYLPDEVNKRDIIFNEHLINWDSDVRLVEGVFDSIVIPNSIPILGKVLNSSFRLYKSLMDNCKSLTLVGDADATDDWLKIAYELNCGKLYGKVRICNYKWTDLKDPSKIYECYRKKGIYYLLMTSRLLL